jgi:hypothetical protein
VRCVDESLDVVAVTHDSEKTGVLERIECLDGVLWRVHGMDSRKEIRKTVIEMNDHAVRLGYVQVTI